MKIIEIQYMLKYASSGLLNTFLGVVVIFSAMAFGITPLFSNILGYLFGFVFGFVLSKKFVFRSNGHFVKEAVRYLLAFAIAFFCNLATLQIWLYLAPTQIFIAQLAAAGIYSIFMYMLVRFYVFRASTVIISM